jgi:hypothetical protein
MVSTATKREPQLVNGGVEQRKHRGRFEQLLSRQVLQRCVKGEAVYAYFLANSGLKPEINPATTRVAVSPLG